jgi:type VI secretion system secreted protein Hcp
MAYQFYMSVKGTRQGQFKGQSTKGKPNSKWVQVHGFQYGVKSPLDTSSGQTLGHRQHDPIVIIKQRDSSSPQLFQACCTKEVLSEVVIEFRQPGSETVVNRISLTNASIDKFEPSRVFPVGVTHHPQKGYENVVFDYQNIKVEGIGA